MDARKKVPQRGKCDKPKVWEPQSRIAGYIKGDVKLEDIVRRDKLVKPEHRHNKRAFLLHLNDDDNDESARKSFDASAKSQTFSSRVHKRSSSANTSVSKNPEPDFQNLARTLVEKSDRVSQLEKQIEVARECVHATEVHDDDDIETAISTLLDCLISVSNALQNVNANDARVSLFVAKVERERKRWFTFATSALEDVRNLRTLNDNLQISNVKQGEHIENTITENTKLRGQLAKLDAEFTRLRGSNERLQGVHDSIVSSEKATSETNLKLRTRVTEYERKYELADIELSRLSQLTEQVRDQFQSKKQAIEESNTTATNQVRELEEKVADLEQACRKLEESRNETNGHIEEMEKRHRNEIQTLKEANEKYEQRLKHETSTLDVEVQRLKDEETTLREDNDCLRTKLIQLTNKLRLANEDLEYTKQEKQTLEEALKECLNKSSNLTKTKENLNSKLLELEETRLHRVMQCLEATVRSARIMPDDIVR